MKMILRYVKPFTARMLRGLCVKFIATIMDLGLPYILAYLIDVVIPAKSMNRIFLWGVIMVVFSAVGVAGNVLANRMAASVARDTTRKIRHDLFDKILHLSSEKTDAYTIPSLVSRMTTDTYNVHQMVDRIQRLGVRGPILLIGGILLTLTLDPAMAGILIATIPFITAATIGISKKGIPLYDNLQKCNDKMVRVLRENISGVRVIKALSKTEYEKKRFLDINDEVTRSDAKAGIVMGATNPVMNVFLNIGMSLVVLTGAYRVMGESTGIGNIVAFTSYFTIILNAMMGITRIFVITSKAVASAKRIESVLEEPEEMKSVNLPLYNTQSHICFQHVSFSYHKNIYNVEDISFEIKHGETLGIIGATGSGKTTVINLLMRFYDADAGRVLIDGKDVRSFSLEALRRKFGVVFQNDMVFADSIRENIDFTRSLPEPEIKKAARDAQADFIGRLNQGFDFYVNARGANLSGGQKQRLLIARALAAKPEILILDDSSSALDYRTDARLRQAIGENYSDTTAVIIAQRVSSIKHADHILVLENGRCAGCGTHEQLMESCGIYREIAVSQMGEGGEGHGQAYKL